MARPVKDDVEQKAIEAGLSRRLSARLGALSRRQVFISDVVMEVLEEGESAKPLQKLLLSPQLVDDSQDLSDDTIRDLVAKSSDPDFFEENPIRLLGAGEAHCIALSDEAEDIEGLAIGDEQGAVPPELPQENLPSVAKGGEGMLSVISQGESSSLFGEGQVAEIKLTLLTSTDSNVKVEAIRKLYLSPISGDAKTALFLIALRDKAADVRSEAARGLGALGLDERVTNNLSRASAGNEAERLVALSNLAQVLPKSGEKEVVLAASVLIGLIERSEPSAIVASAVNVLRQLLSAHASGRRDLVASLHEAVQQYFATPANDLLHAIRNLYRDVIAHDPEFIADLIFKSLEEVSQLHLRSFYVSLITGIDCERTRTPDSMKLMVETLLEVTELDPSYMPLSAGINDLGVAVLPVMLECYTEANEKGRRRLLPIFVEFVRTQDLPQDQIDELAERVLDAFEEGSADMRVAIYDSSILHFSEAGDAVRERAAQLMLGDLHEHELEAGQDLVAGNVLNLGPAAFEPVLNALESSSRLITIRASCELLSELIERHGKDELLESLPAALERLWALREVESFQARGELLRLLGMVGAFADIPAERTKELADWLVDESRQSSNVYDAISGLGWLASGDGIDEQERLELCHFLLGFLVSDNPRLKGSVRRDEEGETYLEVSRDTTAHTVLIPRILAAFDRVLAREGVLSGLWNHMVKTLTEQLKRVANYEIVWAPASTLALARLLGNAGCQDRATAAQRENITETLLLKASLMPVVQVLGKLCRSELSPRMDALSIEVYERLWGMLERVEDLEISEKRDVLRSLGELLLRQRIGHDDDTNKRLRRKIIDALYKELRARTPGVIDLLRRLADDERLPQDERDEIDKRLERLKARRR